MATSYSTAWYAWNTTTYTNTATTGDSAWRSWNDNDTSGSTTWTYWNTDNSITVDNTDTWIYWNTVPSAENNVVLQDRIAPTNYLQAYRKTKAERRRAKRQKQRELKRKLKAQRKARAAAELAVRKLKEAESTAKALLFDVIGEKQMEVFERTGRMLVKGHKFDWLITRTKWGQDYDGHHDHTAHIRIQRVSKEKIYDLCVRLEDSKLPPSDRVLGFLLNSKYNEEEFNNKANVTRPNGTRDNIGECANF